MKRITLLAIPFVLVDVAVAGSIEGRDALILAALVAEQSPKATAANKGALASLLESRSKVPSPSNDKIIVKADAVSCKMSRYDADEFSCKLTFDTKTVRARGRKARELYDALPSEVASGAMGEYFGELTNLNCVIDPAGVRQKTGGGVQCAYDPAERPRQK